MYLNQLGGTAYSFTNDSEFLDEYSLASQRHQHCERPKHLPTGRDRNTSRPSMVHRRLFPGRMEDQAELHDEIWPALRLLLASDEARNMIVSVDTNTGKINTSGYAGLHDLRRPTSRLASASRGRRSVSTTKRYFRIGAGYYYGAGQGEDQFQQILNDNASIQLTSGIAYPVNPAALIASFDPNSPTPASRHAFTRPDMFCRKIFSRTPLPSSRRFPINRFSPWLTWEAKGVTCFNEPSQSDYRRGHGSRPPETRSSLANSATNSGNST